MWLLVLFVLKCKHFWLEAAILHGYSLLLTGYLLMQLFMRYPIKEETDLDKNADLLLERCDLLLHLCSI